MHEITITYYPECVDLRCNPLHSELHSGKYVTLITQSTQKNTVAFHSFPQYIKRRKVCNERVITQTALPPIPPQSGLLLEKWSLILICPEFDYSYRIEFIVDFTFYFCNRHYTPMNRDHKQIKYATF